MLQAKEDARDVWRGGFVAMLTDAWQDVRFGIRMLIKNPAFSLIVIAVLSLGIAGNAAIFSLFKGIALKPLPGVARLGDQLACCLAARSTAAHRRVAPRLSRHHGTRQAFDDLTASMMIFASVGRGADAKRVSPNSSPAITSRRSASARSSGARCCRRTMWRRASIRWR